MKKFIFQCVFYLAIFVSVDAAVDISLIVVDFKYNDQDGVKICEIQPLRASVLKGYYHTHPENPFYIKETIGEWLGAFDIAKWAERRRLGDSELKKLYLENFRLFDFPEEFFAHDPEVLTHQNVLPADENDMHAYTAMAYTTARSLRSISHLRSSYPSVIFLDEAINPLYGDKLAVNNVFEKNEDLISYRPKWGVYKKKYSSQLSKSILKDLDSKRVVIKPRRAAKGYGVIIVNAKELDSTLKFILNKSDELRDHKDKSYSYWYLENNPDFIVEEFISSDPVSLAGNLYDPTYRFVAILHYSHEHPQVTLIDGYGKLPQNHIDAKGSLNEIYKSCGKAPYFSRINPEDYPNIADQVQTCLTLFYKELL